MRRMSAFLGVTAALTPLLLSTATPAQAASGSLTVTTLGRDGKAVVTAPQAVDLNTHAVYYLTSGKAKALPKGRYAVLVDVWNSKDDTDTLGARVVTVSGQVRTTIDARQGRSVKVSLDHGPGAGYEHRYDVSLCVPNAGPGVDAWAEAGHLFVIPNSSSAFQLGYISRWDKEVGDRGPGEQYVVAGLNRTGLPKGLSTVVRRSSLADLKIQVRSGPISVTQSSIDLTRHAANGSCEDYLSTFGRPYTLPYALTAHVSAGSWETAQRGTRFYDYNAVRTFKAGASYGLLFNRSAWGPGGQLPYTWGYGHRLYVDPGTMFTDPSVSYLGASARTTVVLSMGGTTISRKTYTGGLDAGGFNPVIKRAGWYSLSLVSRRYQAGVHFPAGMLSPVSTLRMHFYANPARSVEIPLYLTQFIPTRLSAANRATPGSTTTVGLRMYRPRPMDDLVGYPTDSVRTVKAWASFDSGKSWHAVPVRHSGGSWTALVHNPRSGAVALRSTVLDAHGHTATTTVYRAYAIG